MKVSTPQTHDKGKDKDEHKIKVAHCINTLDDEHIKLVKYFQKRNEDRNLKSVIKDAKR